MRQLKHVSAFLVTSLFALGAAACIAEEPAPEFEEEEGQETSVGVNYAPGPYGIEVGSTVPNYKFVGFRNASNEAYTDSTGLQPIELADFYNPTGDGVFEVDSPYAIAKGATAPVAKPKGLWIIVASVWCGPCNEEARVILPGEYEHYNPLGVEFLGTLADGPQGGVPAEQKHLISWTNKYDTYWPSAIDPTYKLSALFEADAYPANMLIDTTTMKIVEVVAGVPQPGTKFYTELDKLAGNGPATE